MPVNRFSPIRRVAYSLLLLLAGFALSAGSAAAQDAPEKPSADAAASVIDFYYNGQGQGVVLATVQICNEVPTEGENKYGCVDELSPNALRTGTSYALRMVYLVPEGEEIDDILVQYNRGGVTRDTDSVSVSGSIRYRTWEVFTLRDPGDWTIKILCDAPDGVEVLRELTLKVQDADG